jgi:cell division protein ZapA
MATDKLSVKVHIMDKEYQIACDPEQKQRLMKAAVAVDNQMRSIKQSSTRLSVEKVAVLTALNLANELQDATDHSSMLESFSDSIVDMSSRIDRVLDEKQQSADNGDADSKIIQL